MKLQRHNFQKATYFKVTVEQLMTLGWGHCWHPNCPCAEIDKTHLTYKKHLMFKKKERKLISIISLEYLLISEEKIKNGWL